MDRLNDVLRLLNIPPIASPQPIEPPPEEEACPICEGRGFLTKDLPVKHPDFGKVIPCRCRTDVITEQKRQKLQRLSNLGPLTRLSFDNLVPDGRNPETAEHRHRFRIAVTAAQSFAAAPEGWL